MKFLFTATLLLISVFGKGENAFLNLVGIDFPGMTKDEIKQNAQDIIKIMEEEKNSEILALEKGKLRMVEYYEESLKNANNVEIEEEKQFFTEIFDADIQEASEIEIPTEETLIGDITKGQESMEKLLEEATFHLQAANSEDQEAREKAVWDVYYMFEPLLGEDPITQELWAYIDAPLKLKDLSLEIEKEVDNTIKTEMKRSRDQDSKHISGGQPTKFQKQ